MSDRGKTTRRTVIGTAYPAMTGLLSSFPSRLACRYPRIRTRIETGIIDEIICVSRQFSSVSAS